MNRPCHQMKAHNVRLIIMESWPIHVGEKNTLKTVNNYLINNSWKKAFRVDSPLSDARWQYKRDPFYLGHSYLNIPHRTILRVCMGRGVLKYHIQLRICPVHGILNEIFLIKVKKLNVSISPDVGHFEFLLNFTNYIDQSVFLVCQAWNNWFRVWISLNVLKIFSLEIHF